MAFTAYGVSNPRIKLRSKTGAAWTDRHTYTFLASDASHLTPMHAIPVRECPIIELEDNTTREFLRGWRLRWELSFKSLTYNTMIQFVYDWMLGWLADEDGLGYDDFDIQLYPHYDVTTESFAVRVISVSAGYTEKRYPLGYEVKIVFETVDIESTVPYYVP